MTKKYIDVYTLIKPDINKLSKISIETANLDCRLLLSKSLDRSQILYNHDTIEITEDQIRTFRNLIKERLNGKPVSRIINKRNFWKKKFEINEATLDPRPDSETLIEATLKHFKDKLQHLKILDLGSGSGCLGLSILDEYVNSEVSFFDKSKKSLEIVKLNALNFGLLDRSKLIHLDWTVDEWDIKLLKIENEIKFDIIISNPPYIPSNEIKKLQNEVKKYDPLISLDGGKDGLDAYRCVLPKISSLVKNNGKIFIEIGKDQENSISSMARKYGLLTIEFKKDLSGVKRVVVFKTK